MELVYPVQADAVFVRLNPGHVASLQQDWTFYVWDEPIHRPLDDRLRYQDRRRRVLPDVAAVTGSSRSSASPLADQHWFHVKRRPTP